LSFPVLQAFGQCRQTHWKRGKEDIDIHLLKFKASSVCCWSCIVCPSNRDYIRQYGSGWQYTSWGGVPHVCIPYDSLLCKIPKEDAAFPRPDSWTESLLFKINMWMWCYGMTFPRPFSVEQALDMHKNRVEEARACGAETLRCRHMEGSLGKEGLCKSIPQWMPLVFANNTKYSILYPIQYRTRYLVHDLRYRMSDCTSILGRIYFNKKKDMGLAFFRHHDRSVFRHGDDSELRNHWPSILNFDIEVCYRDHLSRYLSASISKIIFTFNIEVRNFGIEVVFDIEKLRNASNDQRVVIGVSYCPLICHSAHSMLIDFSAFF
jgi:hypothetical protein